MPDEYPSPPLATGTGSNKHEPIQARTGDDDTEHMTALHRHLLRLLTTHQARLVERIDQPHLKASDRPLASASSPLAAPAQRRQTLHQRQYRRFCTLCIVALTQSTASLREIVEFASALLLKPASELLPQLRLPNGNIKDSFRSLKRRAILNLDRIAASLSQDPNLRMVSLTFRPNPLVDQLLISDVTRDGPKYWVPAKPWTNATDSDETVSELVSTFLTWMNPFWRLVEEDLFLKAMRARASIVDYCSPLLVNSMLALASVSAERPPSGGQMQG